MTEASPVLSSNEPIQLENLLGYALRRAQLLVFQGVVEAFAPYDLRPAQFTALAIMEQHPGIRQTELARALAIEPPQAVLLLNRLEEKGLALRIRSQTDRRSYGVYLSKQGETLVQELKEVAQKSDQKSSKALNEQERQVLLELLKKLCGDTL